MFKLSVGRVRSFAIEHPLVSIASGLLITGILVLVVWSAGASISETIHSWSYDKKVEKVETQIKADELKSAQADAEGVTLNKESEKRFDEYKASNVETKQLRRQLAAQNQRISELQKEVDGAGRNDRPVAGAGELCARANSLGVRCDAAK